MRRAYRVAERIEAKHGACVAVMLADTRDQLDQADPEDLPDVRFIYQGNDINDEVVRIDATFWQMVESVEGMLKADEVSAEFSSNDTIVA